MTSSSSHLVVIRGNSGSGKSTIAKQLRLHAGRGWALVEQDFLRRIVLRERDSGPGLAPAFIEHNVRFLLHHGYHVILEGILFTGRYGEMLRTLASEHSGPTHFFYFDISFAETVRRHSTRPQAEEFTAEQMRDWYTHRDLLDTLNESVIGETSTEEETLTLIAQTVGIRGG
ncbi:AAA family ATPase [Kineosporia sp. NBRC 101731]|uniref:AAA family ATPase n=1 Tax=Kineosporia sp. NBRC 101731 TaxID=3032199 RepID=UPI0024A4C807|nr:AAA family ATPase [Kineosporia sp. NBRC 101731]GLY27406.1 hypothetical protein Kisp02_07710 [Kineosporia sp. NBRC 101731]